MNQILKTPDDNRFNRALVLLNLHRVLREQKDAQSLIFAVVNELQQLVSYRQCLYWEERVSGQIHIGAASGLVEVDQNAPYLVWLKSMVKRQVKRSDKEREESQQKAGGEKVSLQRMMALSVDSCEPEDRAEWQKWSSAHTLFICVLDDRTGRHYGFWLDRKEIFTQPEQVMLDDLLGGFIYARHMLQGARRNVLGFTKSGVLSKALVVFLVIFLLFPIRLSVTAPAEIVARDPFFISAPYEGVVDQVYVHPNEEVSEGQVVAEMEQTQLESAADVSAQDLAAVKVSLEKTLREALYDPQKKLEINTLRGQLKIKQMEYDYAMTRLEQSKIVSPVSGVAVFSDKNDWRGKPVRTGEKIMQIADVKESELLVRVPVDAMIDLRTDIAAKFFLNVSPLSSENAMIKAIGYQVTPDSSGMLTYKVRLSLDPDADPDDRPQIGWTGTAKLYGERTIMAYYILRRPLIGLRRLLNI